MKNFVIGDIHGNIHALQQVCAMAAIEPEQDRLITLGDVAEDEWLWTPDCVEYLGQFKHLVPLMGNQDVWTSEWLNDGKISAIWPPQGGQATLFHHGNVLPSYCRNVPACSGLRLIITLISLVTLSSGDNAGPR